MEAVFRDARTPLVGEFGPVLCRGVHFALCGKVIIFA